MKARERKARELEIGIGFIPGGFIAAARCPVCEHLFSFGFGESREEATANAQRECPDRCPICGTRLNVAAPDAGDREGERCT